MRLFVLVHNVRSAHNVGALLRTADGAGVERVYLIGCTPCPVDRFGRKRADIAKVALGAEESVHWEYREEVGELLRELRTLGVRIVAVEQDTRSIPYTSLVLDQPTAFLLGAEVGGVPAEVLGLCDTIVEIPLMGSKESLNVSVAAGIVLFHARATEVPHTPC